MKISTWKNLNKYLIGICILVLLPLAIAQEESPPAQDPYTFDSNNPQSFDYINGDYTTITDWSKVDWSKIPANRIPEVPKENIDFSKLTREDQKNSVTTEQLTFEDNLQKVGNLREYKNAIPAINEKYNVEVTSLGTSSEAKALIDQEGFLVADFGNGGNAPLAKLSQGTKVKIDDSGNVIVEGEAKPPQEGYYVATYPVNEDSKIEIGERKGVAVRGQLLVEGKNLFVEEGALIDGILVPKQNNRVRIFLDGGEHVDAGNYVSVGSNKMFIGSNKDTDTSTLLRFTEGNSFFNVKQGDKLNFAVQRGSKIEVEKRDDLIPLVKYTPSGQQSPSETSGAIFNGRNNFHIKKDGEIESSPGNGQGSVPFTLLMQDNEGNNLLGTEGELIKTVFDDNHNFAMIPENLPSEDFECPGCVLDLSNSKVLQNYVKGEILKLEGLQGKNELLKENPAVLSRVLQGLKQLTPEARESINGGVRVVPDNQLLAACGKTSGEIHACRIRKTGEIIVKEGIIPDTIIHEVGHSLDFQLEGNPTYQAEKNLKAYELQLARKYNVKPEDLAGSGRLTQQEADRYAELIGATLEEIEQTELQKSYKNGLQEITRDVPFRKDITHDHRQALPSKWPDETTGPKKEFAPCPSAYACSSQREFVAEWAMTIATKDAEFWKPLVTPPGQPGHDPNQYDESYWETYQFFAQHGFVTEENKEKMNSIRPSLIIPSSSLPEGLLE